ncbi:MAG TPA: TonB family protein [Ignavibacteriaceae bacterium]|nr:TonB family protein [Ignavibacteriaceae bacterium]
MKKIFLAALFYSISILPQDSPVKTYFPNGKVESEINYNGSVREGEAKFYYEDGTLKEERLYVNGRVEGLVKTYHPNGKIKELINLEDGKREGPTSIFDEEGIYVKDIYYERGIQFIEKKNIYVIEEPKKEIVKNTKKPKDQSYEFPPLEEEKIVEENRNLKDTVEVMPEPVGGFESIKKKLIYPVKAKEDGIEGIVEIEVLVDEFGEVQKADIFKGIRADCDESAKIAVYYTKFKPGMQKGKPVKVQFIVPVEFKIFDKPLQ